jgi:hypothetical protein
MCGSSDLVKQEGVFICQSCGVKYSIEEARKMMTGSNEAVEVVGKVTIDNDFEISSGVLYKYNGSDTQVIIPDNVTIIESFAFANLGITDVSIPDSVTEIRSGVFSNCKKLTSVIIPNSVNALGVSRVMDVFSDVSDDLVKKDATPTVSGHLFGVAKGLTKEYSGDLIQSAKSGGTIGVVASVADNITKDYKEVNTGVFQGCESLQSAILPDGIYSVPSRIFADCTSLTEVTIPNKAFQIESKAFSNCQSLLNIDIPDSIKSIEPDAFEGCPSVLIEKIADRLQVANSKAQFEDIIKEISEMPDSINNTPIVGIPLQEDKFEFVIENGTLRKYLGEKSVVEIPESVTAIASNVFMTCTDVTQVVVPEGVDTFGDAVFSGCTSLTNVTLPSVMSSWGKNVFQECSNLREIVIPYGIKEIKENTFDGCVSISNITIPISLVTIAAQAFRNCRSLKNLRLPKHINNGSIAIPLFGMPTVFAGCENLLDVEHSINLEEAFLYGSAYYRKINIKNYSDSKIKSILKNSRIKTGGDCNIEKERVLSAVSYWMANRSELNDIEQEIKETNYMIDDLTRQLGSEEVNNLKNEIHTFSIEIEKLGFLKGKEKKELQVKKNLLEDNLSSIETSLREEIDKMQSKISELDYRLDNPF